MKRIIVGQIGVGHNHAQAIMAAVRKRPDLFEIAGFCETDDVWLKRRGNLPEYTGLPFLTEQQIIERCDAVFVETEVRNLLKTAKKCVDCGKHVHIDKPVMGRSEEYADLLKTAQSKGLIVQMGYMYRYNPAVKKCFEIVKSGKLGEIYSINAEMSTRHDKEFREWLKNFPCGNMFIFGCHFIDLIVYLMGAPEKITTISKVSGLDGINPVDLSQTVLEYAKTMARIYVSSIEVNGWGRRQFVICGSKGTLEIRPMENPCKLFYSDLANCTNAYMDIKSEIPVTETPMDCRYDEMIEDFYHYVQGEKENPFTYEHELLLKEVTDKVCKVKNRKIFRK